MGSSGGVETKNKMVQHLSTSTMSLLPLATEALWQVRAQASSLGLIVAHTSQDQ